MILASFLRARNQLPRCSVYTVYTVYTIASIAKLTDVSQIETIFPSCQKLFGVFWCEVP